MSVFGYFPIIFAHILFSANNAFWPFPTGQCKKKNFGIIFFVSGKFYLWFYLFFKADILQMENTYTYSFFYHD